jgi:hypothetical protein
MPYPLETLARRLLPRSPVVDQRCLPLAMFWCPAVAHSVAPTIVCFVDLVPVAEGAPAVNHAVLTNLTGSRALSLRYGPKAFILAIQANITM